MLAGAQNVDMERRMKLAKLSFPEQKCLAIIRPVYYKEPAYYKSRLIPDMQAIFGKTAFSVVKNDLVLLLPADRRHQQLFSGQQPAFTPL